MPAKQRANSSNLCEAQLQGYAVRRPVGGTDPSPDAHLH